MRAPLLAIRRKTRVQHSGTSPGQSNEGSANLTLAVQRALRSLDYYMGVDDGAANPDFAASLTDLQFDSGLPMTGEIDGATLQAIRRRLYLAKHSSGDAS